MYTINDFLKEKLAVRIDNQRQWNRFIDICEKHGATFGDNNVAKEWTHDWEHRSEVILCRTCWSGQKALTWQFADDELPPDTKMVHVDELLCPAVEETGRVLNTYFPNGFPKPEPKPAPEDTSCRNVPHTKLGSMRYKIIIECDGETTLARMQVNGHTVKRVAAKRNPADKFNWRIGAQTAFNRLWEKKKKPKKGAENERAAKPGEYVRIVESCLPGTPFAVGSVVKIVDAPLGCEVTNHAYYKNGMGEFLYPFEYVVLEGYKPE